MAQLSGNELHNWLRADDRPGHATPAEALDDAEALGYIKGVADSFVGKAFCPPATGLQFGQVKAIVKKHLEANPDRWNEAATGLVIEPLRKAYPCKK